MQAAFPVKDFHMELLRLSDGPEPQKGTKPYTLPGKTGENGIDLRNWMAGRIFSSRFF